jgi:hypothetical protein
VQKVTLEFLRERVRRLADEQSSSGGASSFVSPEDLDDAINEAIPSYYALLTEVQGQEFFVKKHQWPLEKDVSEYDLPLDFGLGALQVQLERDQWRYEIFAWQQQDSAYLHNLRGEGGTWTYEWLITNYRATLMRYRLQGEKLELLPTPESDNLYTLHMRYVPRCPQLVNDSDEIDSVNGWHKYVCWHAAVTLLIPGETDEAPAERQLLKIEREIRAHAPKRDRGRPEVVQDTLNDDWASVGYWGGSTVVREP